MEKLFFRKIELWLVFLLVLVMIVGSIFFAAIVRNVAQGKDRFARLGEIAYAIASIPENAEDLLSFGQGNWMSVTQNNRFGDRTGWNFATPKPDGQIDGYILLSRYDGAAQNHVIELFDLRSREAVYRMDVMSKDFLQGWESDKNNSLATPWIPNRFRAIHPLILPGGDILIKDHGSPLVRLTPCGELVWRQEELDFHHATEAGPDGAFWLPVRVPFDQPTDQNRQIGNMGIAKVDTDGQIVYLRSIGDIFIDHGLEYLIRSVEDFEENPMYLNDIQPVLEDGPFWKKGDLFLSFRALSAIVLFRPSSDSIIWMKSGPWLGQHDVDIVDDHTIAIFNNDTINFGEAPEVRGTNKITFYDFATDETSEPFNSQLGAADVRTVFGGLFSILPAGQLMVEETGAGRLIIFDAAGEILVDYVNRASDGKICFLGWSRFLDRSSGDAIRDALNSADCAD